MMTAVKESVEDADLLIVLVDVTNADLTDDHLALIAKATCPVILIVNKVDLSTPDKVVVVMADLKEKNAKLQKKEMVNHEN